MSKIRNFLFVLMTGLLPILPVRASAPGHHETPPPGLIPAAPGKDIILTTGETPAPGWSASRPDSHAPIGVTGDHMHHAGEFMLSYRYAYRLMEDSGTGTRDLSTNQVLEDYMAAPLRMEMHMHMVGGMYAPADWLTLVLMAPYIQKEMEARTRMGQEFTTRSEGFGDLMFAGLFKVAEWDRQRLHFNLGVSAPTGSIDERDDTPAGSNSTLAYPMQLGSGTWDAHPALVYLGQDDVLSWGAKLGARFPLGENDEGYSIGNRYSFSPWIATKLSKSFSLSLRAEGQAWDDYDGADPRLNPGMSPGADSTRRSGERIDLALGLNFYNRAEFLRGHRLAIEAGVPVYQRLDGVQLKANWFITCGWQYAF